MPATAYTYFSYVPLTSVSQGIMAWCVQLFYAWRIKVITNNISAVILVVSCATIGMSKLTVLMWRQKLMSDS